jgi:hypothetical protein
LEHDKNGGAIQLLFWQERRVMAQEQAKDAIGALESTLRDKKSLQMQLDKSKVRQWPSSVDDGATKVQSLDSCCCTQCPLLQPFLFDGKNKGFKAAALPLRAPVSQSLNRMHKLPH